MMSVGHKSPGSEIPEDLLELVEGKRAQMLEQVADFNDELMGLILKRSRLIPILSSRL